jgi:O-acetylhomoserine (thiol)-lyase
VQPLFAKVRIEGLRDYGAALSPFNAFQIIQGLETLAVRVKTQRKWIGFSSMVRKSKQVAWVNYPSLESSKYYDLAQHYFERSKWIVNFGLKEDLKLLKSG